MQSLFDDTSMVFTNAQKDGADMLHTFALFARSSGLELNTIKIVVTPLWSGARPNHPALIAELLAIFVGFILAKSSKYLGLLISTNAHLQPWSLVLPGYQKAVRTLRNLAFCPHCACTIHRFLESSPIPCIGCPSMEAFCNI
jgi:hypothetical protein